VLKVMAGLYRVLETNGGIMASKIMLRDRKPFAQWLRQWLARNRIKVSEFEQSIGAAHGMASHWLNARRSPSPRYIEKIAAYTGEDVDFLLTMAGYRPTTLEITDDADPRVRLIAKVRQIIWDERSLRYVEGFLDSLIAESREAGTGKLIAPMKLQRRTTPGRATLVSSPN
jgi:transcriptional regulator with XRE-family HTH domain